MLNYNNPCNTCGSPCPEECSCPEPLYSPLGCASPVPFKCVQLLEKNLDGTNISYPCLPFATGESLFTLTQRLNTWKCDYDVKITKVRTSSTDTVPGYLSDKVLLGECLIPQIMNSGGNEKLKISIDYDCLLAKIVTLPGFCTAASACTVPQCIACTSLTIS